jgi:hypothetical protein
MAKRCSVPAPNHRGELVNKGKCEKHGRWYACYAHANFTSCPMCSLAEAAAAAEERRASEEHERQEAERERQLFIAEFQEQGYSRVAAEALATKRQRDKPQLERERQEAEENARKEKEFAAGTGGTCPVCKWHVRLSGGIVLTHDRYVDHSASDYHSDYRPEPCPGIGEHAWPPGVQHASQLTKDWPHQ